MCGEERPGSKYAGNFLRDVGNGLDGRKMEESNQKYCLRVVIKSCDPSYLASWGQEEYEFNANLCLYGEFEASIGYRIRFHVKTQIKSCGWCVCSRNTPA